VIRTAGTESWAIAAVEQSNALANTQRGSERVKNIRVSGPFLRRKTPEKHKKLRFQRENAGMQLARRHPFLKFKATVTIAGGFASRLSRELHRQQRRKTGETGMLRSFSFSLHPGDPSNSQAMKPYERTSWKTGIRAKGQRERSKLLDGLNGGKLTAAMKPGTGRNA
jgi:hypothetical protein